MVEYGRIYCNVFLRNILFLCQIVACDTTSKRHRLYCGYGVFFLSPKNLGLFGNIFFLNCISLVGGIVVVHTKLTLHCNKTKEERRVKTKCYK